MERDHIFGDLKKLASDGTIVTSSTFLSSHLFVDVSFWCFGGLPDIVGEKIASLVISWFLLVFFCRINLHMCVCVSVDPAKVTNNATSRED